MDKIADALKKLLPEADVAQVAAAVTEMLESAKAELHQEYESKLEEAYAKLTAELASAEKTAEEGYAEAHAIIAELRTRLERQGEEYKAEQLEGYEEAYQMIKKLEEEKEQLSTALYEEYEKKFSKQKEYMIDKLDEFLSAKGQEIYEQARRDVMNDPRMAEHKVALDKIAGITSQYLSDEDFDGALSTKLEEATRSVEDLRGQIRTLEARNVKLSVENTKLNESVRQAAELITEAKKAVTSKQKEEIVNEQRESVKKTKGVTGSGSISADDGVVIAEYATNDGDMDDLRVLAGVKVRK